MIRGSQRLLAEASKNKPSYSKSLLLPQTDFLPRIPKGDVRRQLIDKSSRDLYLRQLTRDDYNQVFTLHDGPPYANGDLHLGHALNKILKDIVNRFELMYRGSKVKFTPGWDCHGLPIETKAVKDTKGLTPTEIRKLCRQLALEMIETQREQFRQYAIMTDFHNPYVTMSHKYEVSQMEIFLKLFENGLLSRQLKPVWWGCETQTALAEAELDYNPKHKSVAVFVKFPLEKSAFTDKYGPDVSVLIWTSTSWTIPANKAICINRDVQYTLIRHIETNEKVVVARGLVKSVLELNPAFVAEEDIVFPGSDLEGLNYENPSFMDNQRFPIVHGDHVSDTAGTGLVHTAPAHGLEDYFIGKKHGLHVASSIDGRGLYDGSVIPKGFQELAGKYANGKPSIFKCIGILDSFNMLFHVNKAYSHSYPYDWRSKTAVVQRATPQWFVNVEKIKDAAIQLLQDVTFVPEVGINRLSSFIQNRTEWCISRQRTWGVPLPILYNKQTDEPVEDVGVIRYTIKKMEEYGTDAWFEEEADVARWLPDGYDGTQYYKGKDTMDVWFDSGTSWSTLSENLDELVSSDKPLADVYLEGSDQHRGWFQLSLLNKIIASASDGKSFKPVAPFKKIITHGFLLDKKNVKMSKSKGNVISPEQVIEGGGKPLVPALGTDGLRLWVASSTYTLDVNISPEIFQRVLENVKKFRVTFRYLLGNLLDFSQEKAVSYEELSRLDKWVLSRLKRVQDLVVGHYSNHNFAGVVRELNIHVSELSGLYFDISKDCLYTAKQDSKRRRAIQTVLEEIFKTYTSLLAPIQPLIAQEAYQSYAVQRGLGDDSPFMVPFSEVELPETYKNNEIDEEFEKIFKIRDALYKTLEELRSQGHFKNKLEVEVFLEAEGARTEKLLEAHKDFLDDYFLVSRATIGGACTDQVQGPVRKIEVEVDEENSVGVTVQQSQFSKCPRCWKYISESEDTLCKKCDAVYHDH